MFLAFLREIRTGKFIRLWPNGESYSDFAPEGKSKGEEL